MKIRLQLSIFLVMCILNAQIGYSYSLQVRNPDSINPTISYNSQLTGPIPLSVKLNNLIQVSLYYGINKNDLEATNSMKFTEKIYFFIHKSLFVQLLLLFITVTFILFVIHYRFKMNAQETLEKLVLIDNEKGLFDNYNKLSCDPVNKINNVEIRKIKKENLNEEYFNSTGKPNEEILQVESNKYNTFINSLEGTFYQNK